MNSEAAEHLQDLVDDGRLDDALALVDSTLSADRDDPRLHAYRGLLLSDLKRREEARDAVALALELDPDDPFIHFVSGEIALEAGEILEAIQAAQRARAIYPEYHEAILLEARARARSGQWPAARELAARVLAEDPDSEPAALLHAAAAEQGTDGPLSAERWEALATRFPLNAVARAGRAWVELQSGEATEAEAEFRQALALDPSFEAAREGLVVALKARNPVYRLFLRLLMKLNQLPPRTRGWLVIGGMLGYNVLRRVAKTYPAVEPYVFPVLVVYVAFVLFSWLADPLMSLLLMVRPDARPYLSEDDKRSGLGVGGLLGAAILIGGVGTLVGWAGSALTGFGIGAATFTVSAAYKARPGPGRQRFLRMAGAVVALSLAAGIVPGEIGSSLFVGAILLVAVSTWMTWFNRND